MSKDSQRAKFIRLFHPCKSHKDNASLQSALKKKKKKKKSYLQPININLREMRMHEWAPVVVTDLGCDTRPQIDSGSIARYREL